MENEQENKEVVNEEVKIEENSEEVVSEPSVDELKQLLANAKAENLRKTQELQKAREEALRANAVPDKPVSQDPREVLKSWKDHELKAMLKDASQAAYHDYYEEELTRRRFQRYQNEQVEKQVRLNSELERQKKYPETFDPSHPMSVRMQELMALHRLDNSPSGRLVAAELAHKEVLIKKAADAGRKNEQNRQADVNASFNGGAPRPAPKPSDKAKLDELKKRAMEGDKAAQVEWFKLRGII